MEGEHLSRYAVTSYNGNRKISNLINSDKRYEFTGRLTLQENTFPEKIKIERQQNALDDFFKGYVKNPYLSTYLFSPSELQKPAVKSYSNWEWQLDGRLNEKQKDAVMKAVASNGLFLLQGPPGTGKNRKKISTIMNRNIWWIIFTVIYVPLSNSPLITLIISMR